MSYYITEAFLREDEHDEDDEQHHEEADHGHLPPHAALLDHLCHLALHAPQPRPGALHVLVQLIQHGRLRLQLLTDGEPHVADARHALGEVVQGLVLLPHQQGLLVALARHIPVVLPGDRAVQAGRVRRRPRGRRRVWYPLGRRRRELPLLSYPRRHLCHLRPGRGGPFPPAGDLIRVHPEPQRVLLRHPDRLVQLLELPTGAVYAVLHFLA
mmetsp:Transcript_68173/g.215662  ORF Transcript_68173/g.215662 Transcript_68173/m.215662 type:complete len:212 (+) Transcript_68173:830-1465(+)